MESTHRKLCSGLANGLCRHNSNGLSANSRLTGCKVDTVTMRTHATVRSAVKDRTDGNFKKSRRLNGVCNILCNQFILSDKNFTGLRMNDLKSRITARKTVCKRLDNIFFIVGNNRKFCDEGEVLRSAVL